MSRISIPGGSDASGAYPAIVLGPGSGYALVSDEDAHDPAGSGNGVMWQAGTDGGSDQGLRVFTGDGSEHSLEFLGDGVLKVDGEPVGASAPYPAVTARIKGANITFAEAAASVPIEVYYPEGAPSGWTLSVDEMTAYPPVGVYVGVLRIGGINVQPDAPFDIAAQAAGQPGAHALLGTADYAAESVLGPVVIATAGTDGVQVIPSYSDTEPTAGEVGWQLHLWRIGDVPA